MKYSQIISYFKQPEILEKTLHIWTRQTFPEVDYEILIMDGGQDEEGIKVAKAYSSFLNLRYFTYDGRVDYKCPVHAWNVGIRQSRGAIIGLTMEDRFTTFNAVEALYRPHTKGKAIFCTVLPWIMKGNLENDLMKTVAWRENPELLLTVAEPTIIAAGKKKENETVLYSLSRKIMIALGGFDERWRDYGYWMLDLYQRFLDRGLRRHVVSEVINVHHHHVRHGTMQAHKYDGPARVNAWKRIKKLNNHGVIANVGNPSWGAMDGDEEVSIVAGSGA